MKQPLLPVALFYVGGILLADWFLLSLPVLFAWSIALAVLCLIWNQAGSRLLAVLLVLTGATNLTLHTVTLSPCDLRSIIEGAKEVEVRGRLCETPYQRVFDADDAVSQRTLTRLDVDALRLRGSTWQPAHGRVAVTTPGVLPNDFFGGRVVVVNGVLAPPKGPVAKGLFDYRTYLRRQGIHHQLKVTSPTDWSLPDLSTPAPVPVADRFGTWAKTVLARGLPTVDEPLRLLWAMTLGWKTALSDEVSEPFMRSGTMHIFAISGLHIALIAGILVAALRFFKAPRWLCGVLVIPLLWAYTGVTGWQASAIRSTVMMSVIIAGWSLHRPSDLLNSLAAAALIILLWDPQQLFQASFQLSFFVVLSLALFAPILRKVQERVLRRDPMLPDELRPRWQRVGFSAANNVATGVTTSLAAWLGSIPLVACYFNLFTPVSLLANVIVVPLSSAALACNLASLAVGGWFPACAELFNHSAWFWMVLMVRISEWAAQVPGGCFHVATPQPLTFVLYYATLIAVMAGWLKQPRVRVWTASLLAVLAVAWLTVWARQRSATWLTVLPLNGGHAAYLAGREARQDWLIDSGSESSTEFTTKPFLRANGVDRLSHLLLTHGDVRHVGGAELIAKQFAAQMVHLSDVRFRSPIYRRITGQFQEATNWVRRFRRGDQRDPWSVLHPEAGDSFSQADDSAAVLRADLGGTRVLLLSDLGKAGQNALMQRTADLRADIVVSGLPTASEALADGLLDAIQPKLIVLADSDYPATERASAPLRERLARRRIPVLYTRETGAVEIELRPGRWEATAMDDTRVRGSNP